MTPNSFYSDSLFRRSLRVVVATAGEQVSIDEARGHLRLDNYGSPPAHPDDSLLEQIYIPAARRICEGLSGRALVPQTYELGIGRFPCAGMTYHRAGVRLQIGPVTSVTSVKYDDSNAVEQELLTADYLLDSYTEPGYIYPAINSAWPTTGQTPNAVRIRFEAGYDLPSASPQDNPLPQEYKAAILLVMGHLYENREQTTVLKLEELKLGVHQLLGLDALRKGFA